MQIFGRDVPDAEALWQWYGSLATTPAIWRKDSLAASAKQCGFKRVSERKNGYFAFSLFEHATGQAPVQGELVEEIRLFIGQEPKDLAMDLWEKDHKKHAALAKQYARRFQDGLGAPRLANGNSIFEANGLRVRVLAAECVWVVVSSLEVVRQMPEDYWKPTPP